MSDKLIEDGEEMSLVLRMCPPVPGLSVQNYGWDMHTYIVQINSESASRWLATVTGKQVEFVKLPASAMLCRQALEA